MISAKVFIIAAMLIQQIYRLTLTHMEDVQRKKPLPEEVADVYDADRYQKYLEYTADRKKLRNKFKVINIAVEIAVLFSPIFSYIERISNGDPYKTFFITYGIMWFISLVIDTWSAYEVTFGLLEKYGLNKKDKKEFVKDEVLHQSFNLFITVVFMLLVIYAGEHFAVWTDNFSVGFTTSLAICSGVFAVGYAFVCIAKLIGYLVLKKQYVFTPLEEGELRDKINMLQEGCKKKVKEINIYNESKKTTMKNAFLLKLFWHREFGIADNFITGNAEGELLAVLSHEIGHLKHRKDLRNFIQYGLIGCYFLLVAYILSDPGLCLWINAWIRDSFNISGNNYVLLMMVYGDLLSPVLFLNGIYMVYVSRCEEYEADREAVKNGYGEELIKTFKTLSSDELVNVNPHPFTEFTEYDHPSMYRRIKAIREAVAAS